jgi:O-antigen/teichoic acid export membrane protein
MIRIRQRLLTGAAVNVAGRFTSAGIWFLLTPIVLAHLGRRGYALWTLMGAMASYGWLLDFGIGGAVVKYVAEHVARGERAAARMMIGSASLLSLGLAAVMVLTSVALAAVIPGLLDISAGEQALAKAAIVLTGIDVAVTIAFSPRVSVLRGLQRYDLYNGVQIFGALLQAGVTVIVLKLGGGVPELIAANIPVNLAMRMSSTALIRQIAPDLVTTIRSARRSGIRRLTSYCCSASTIDVAGRLHNKTDEFVIAVFGPLSAVTPYALARRLGEVTSLAATQCAKVVMPLASELEATDRIQKLRKLYIVASRMALAIATPVAVVLGVSGGTILSLWVGPAYADQGALVAVLAAASLLNTSQWPAAEILQGITKHRIVAWTSIGAGVANVTLSILLLPVFGLMGVALGTLIPTVISSMFVVMPFANRTLNVSWSTALREIWLPGIAPAVPAALVLLALNGHVETSNIITMAASIAIAALVYAIGYLSMPPTTAERALVVDLMSSGSRSVRRVLLDPLRVR